MIGNLGRQPVHARNALASSQPLAAAAGLEVLRAGGNAVDAAVAMAACLAVVEPTSNGIGGDLFAIVSDGDDLVGLNASGRSPAGWTPGRFAGLTEMPRRGWDSVTVPGCVSGWAALAGRFGRLPLARLLAPAIRHARHGFPVAPICAHYWRMAERAFPAGEFPAFAETFLPAPAAGEIWRSEPHARTLETIAESNGEDFYRGGLARQIAEASAASGGALTADDLAAHEVTWHAEAELIRADAFGVSLFEMPPNGQGVAAAMALGITAAVAPPADWFDAGGLHLQLEAMKLAFADLHAHVADLGAMAFDPARLVDPAYLAGRAALLNRERAEVYAAGVPTAGGTVNLAVGDESGMMVSLIQSNYAGFGSGCVVPGTGVALHNRGSGFVLAPGHPNEVGPGKRPFHTIIPGFVKRGGRPEMAFGLMGGPMQAQGHLQLMLRIFAEGQNVQAAVDAPRWQVIGGRRAIHERGLDPAVVAELRQRGHDLSEASFEPFGGAQLVRRLDNGTYAAASDPRKDGHAAGF